jgi:primosomal protein N' (replication factor Y)
VEPPRQRILAALEHDYARFATAELPSRKEHLYPPFASLIRLIIRGESEPATEQFADAAGEKLRTAIDAAQIEHRVLGPAPCPIAKLRGLFRFHVLTSSSDGDKLRAAVRNIVEQFEPVEGIQWVVDVDPLDLL